MLPLELPSNNIKTVDRGGQSVVIAFSGLYGREGYPRFEFESTIRDVGANAVFVCDHAQAWYNRGIPGLGAEPVAVALALRKLTDELFPTQPVTTIGNSMGGYAAMLFACLCGYQGSVAFAPQITIPDVRWMDYFSGLVLAYPSVVPVIRAASAQHTVVIGTEDIMDIYQAMAVVLEPKVDVLEVQGAAHDVALTLRERGELVDRLRHALDKNGTTGVPEFA